LIELLLLGIGLMIAAAAGVASLEVLMRRPELAVALVLGATVFKAALLDRAPSLNLPGGVQVQIHDIVFALLLAAGILRLLRAQRLATLERWLLLLGIMLLVSLFRGAMAFGLQHSVSEFRLYTPFISTAVYFASFRPSSIRNDRIGKIWLVATIPMLILVCLRWVQNLAGVNLGVPAEQFGGDAAFRVINGPYAFFVSTAVMLTVPFWQLRDERARKLTRVGALLLLFVVLLNRRTVWITLLAGVATVMLRGRRLSRRAVLMLIVAAIVTVGAFLAFPRVGSETEPVTNPFTTSTLDWRFQGWSELVDSWSKDPVDWIVGQPFGSGFARTIEGSDVEAEPHNLYITTLLRTGVVGALALIVLYAGLLRALWRTPGGGSGLLSPNVFPALLVTQLVWFLTWIPGNEQGIITGLALALAVESIRSRRALPSSLAARQPSRVAAAAIVPSWPLDRPSREAE
jgi:O-Antigen ligase